MPVPRRRRSPDVARRHDGLNGYVVAGRRRAHVGLDDGRRASFGDATAFVRRRRWRHADEPEAVPAAAAIFGARRRFGIRLVRRSVFHRSLGNVVGRRLVACGGRRRRGEPSDGRLVFRRRRPCVATQICRRRRRRRAVPPARGRCRRPVDLTLLPEEDLLVPAHGGVLGLEEWVGGLESAMDPVRFLAFADPVALQHVLRWDAVPHVAVLEAHVVGAVVIVCVQNGAAEHAADFVVPRLAPVARRESHQVPHLRKVDVVPEPQVAKRRLGRRRGGRLADVAGHAARRATAPIKSGFPAFEIRAGYKLDAARVWLELLRLEALDVLAAQRCDVCRRELGPRDRGRLELGQLGRAVLGLGELARFKVHRRPKWVAPRKRPRRPDVRRCRAVERVRRDVAVVHDVAEDDVAGRRYLEAAVEAPRAFTAFKAAAHAVRFIRSAHSVER
mmetsp:Transcript_6418/g.20555  ORF Transcript_6418/g.20555 Transcript_6418/m.20555 type:complete len:445 (+) Transcript_6418:2530-3864(+)